LIPHAGAPPLGGEKHTACPFFAEEGPAHAFVQDPQWATSVGSTHEPLQSSDVELSTSHETAHAPLVHVAWPSPASGPAQTLLHEPQCDGTVGSTQTPSQSSDRGAVHREASLAPSVRPSTAASSEPVVESPASMSTTMMTGGFIDPPSLASATSPGGGTAVKALLQWQRAMARPGVRRNVSRRKWGMASAVPFSSPLSAEARLGLRASSSGGATRSTLRAK